MKNTKRFGKVIISEEYLIFCCLEKKIEVHNKKMIRYHLFVYTKEGEMMELKKSSNSLKPLNIHKKSKSVLIYKK